MRRPGKKTQRGKTQLKLVKGSGSEEEEGQLADLAAGHPWALTLRGFLGKVRSDYGFSGPERFRALDPKDKKVQSYLLGDDGKTRVYLPGNLGLDDQMNEYVTASLCRRMGIPPEDFGLPPSDKEGGD